MAAYYNENEPYAAMWLRNLIVAGHIAPGDVDERSIADVMPSDLIGYTQCHFFAGIGGWSIALRLAEWPDDQPVWTGSCPCQPFSGAGKRSGAADERHLWPHWFRLIRECRPPTVFGEQVEAAIGWGWLDAVCADLEAEGYATGAAVLPACSVGAPHIRQRLWFVAHPNGRHPGSEGLQRGGQQRQQPQDGGAGELVYSTSEQVGLSGRPREPRATAGELGNASGRGGAHEPVGDGSAGQHVGALAGTAGRSGVGDRSSGDRQTAPGNAGAFGFWSDCDWLPCTDGKARPVEPGSFPLAHGVQRRASKLRAFGNAIVPQVAARFIEAYQTRNKG